MDHGWVAVLNAHYTIMVNGAVQPFRKNFERLVPKIALYGRYKFRVVWAEIKQLVKDDGLRAAGLLCHMLHMGEDSNGVQESAFLHLMRKVPAEMDTLDFSLHLQVEGHATPLILYQECQDGAKMYIYTNKLVVDVTEYCKHGGHALELLFKVYVVEAIEYPKELIQFFEFLKYFLASDMKPNATSPAPHELIVLHRILVETNFHSMWQTFTM